MIASGAVPALLPAHIGVSQTNQFTTQSGLCRHPALLAYTAAAGTATADSLKLLASWAAAAEQAGDLPAHA